MMFDIPKAVEAVSNALKGIFDFASTAKEHQSETQIIKENKKLKKASDIAEDAFKLMFKNYELLSEKDKKRLKDLYDNFLEHN